WFEFIHPDDRAAVRDASRRALRHPGHRAVGFRSRVVDIDGVVHWLDWTAAHDAVTGLVYATAREVTDDVAAQHELERELAIANEGRAAAERAQRESEDARALA